MSIAADGMTDRARENVDRLLELRGQPIALIPATGQVTVKPGGYKDYAPAAPRPPQVFAKFNKNALDGQEHGQTDRGSVRQFIFEMIGAYDATVQLGDSWQDDAATYQVEMVDNTQPYQVKATVRATLKVQGHSFA